MGRRCSHSEIPAFTKYQLAKSNTSDFVLSAIAEVGLERSDVVGTVAVGRLLTFFKNIGDAHPDENAGGRYFTVSGAAALLTDGSVKTDAAVAAMRATVLQYMAFFAGPESAPWVTIAACSDAQWLVDGNKTTIAAFLYARERGKPDLVLPVYSLPFPTKTLAQLTHEA